MSVSPSRSTWQTDWWREPARWAAAYPTAEVQDLTEFKEAQSAPIDQLLGLKSGAPVH